MAKNFFLLLFIAFLSSCISVEFTKPQPFWCENLTAFPKEMQGNYYSNENDTFEIGNNYYKLVSTSDNSFIDVSTINTVSISDSLLLKFYDKAYFLNNKENENWRLSMIKLNKDKSITVYSALESEEKLIKKVNRVLDKTILKDEKGKIKRIILNPTKKEFLKLVKSKLFVKYLVLKKIN